MFLQPFALPAQNCERVLLSGFFNVNRAEAPIQRRVLGDGAAVFFVGGRANTHDFAACQRRFEDVGGVEVAVNRITCADNSMNFVDEQDHVSGVAGFVHDADQPFLELSA